jgi:hypothetical protein
VNAGHDPETAVAEKSAALLMGGMTAREIPVPVRDIANPRGKT